MLTHILLAEDEDITRRLVTQALEKDGHLVHGVANGRDCLTALQSGLNPDLVLLDLEMPEMGGLAVMQEMARLGMLKRYPVVVCTSRKEPAVVKQAIGSGAIDYIVKPFDVTTLGSRISDLVFKATEAELKALMLQLRHPEPELLQSPGLQPWQHREVDAYQAMDRSKLVCVLLPRGKAPAELAKASQAQLAKKIAIFRKCTFGWRQVWPLGVNEAAAATSTAPD